MKDHTNYLEDMATQTAAELSRQLRKMRAENERLCDANANLRQRLIWITELYFKPPGEVHIEGKE